MCAAEPRAPRQGHFAEIPASLTIGGPAGLRWDFKRLEDASTPQGGESVWVSQASEWIGSLPGGFEPANNANKTRRNAIGLEVISILEENDS